MTDVGKRMEVEVPHFTKSRELLEDVQILFASPPKTGFSKVIGSLDILEETLKRYDDAVSSLTITEEYEDEREPKPKGKRIGKKLKK